MEAELEKCSREYLIYCLWQNDRNGIFRDEDSLRETGSVMTKEECKELIIKIVTENY
ncbi:MAG TPA: hypothetical protein VK175_06305 [Leadbetterella sp.]|nr:hypothetical protein [Leadbetterella sp.]